MTDLEAFQASREDVVQAQHHAQERQLAGLRRFAFGDGLTYPQDPRQNPYSLAPKELAILDSMCRGELAKQTAYRTHMSIKTVEWYRRQIFRKVGEPTTLRVVIRAFREGLVPLDDAPGQHTQASETAESGSLATGRAQDGLAVRAH